jgi:hypothetical protein
MNGWLINSLKGKSGLDGSAKPGAKSAAGASNTLSVAVSAPESRGFFASIGSFNGRVCEEYKTRKGNNSACLRQVTSAWPPTVFVGFPSKEP